MIEISKTPLDADKIASLGRANRITKMFYIRKDKDVFLLR